MKHKAEKKVEGVSNTTIKAQVDISESQKVDSRKDQFKQALKPKPVPAASLVKP